MPELHVPYLCPIYSLALRKTQKCEAMARRAGADTEATELPETV